MKKLLFLMMCLSASALAQPQQPVLTTGSSQFISYWKSHVVTPQQDARVALAQQVFARLLRAWDSSRLAPALYVVDDDAGPWAASLVDGNILLSVKALDAIDSFEPQRTQDLLAFVLAHEIAHQRADDLWQHRFFRLDPDKQAIAIMTQPLDQHALQALEQKEERADHDGLILMSSVGFNPYRVVGQKDFFTAWVENIWRQPCNSQQDEREAEACQQARQRALRSLAQLDTVASQSSLYDLGVQALVANNFSRARYYFSQFGRDFPNRAVMSALGLSYLSQAIALRKLLIQQGLIEPPALFYPLLLDASSGFDRIEKSLAEKRAGASSLPQRLQKINQLAEQAGEYFEKAIRLAPRHQNSYLLLAEAYLLQRNSYRVRGVLQGRYTPRFGANDAVAMLLALTDSIEGKQQQAITALQHLLDKKPAQQSVLPDDLLQYSLSWNLASLLRAEGKNRLAKQVWRKLAKRAKTSGNGYLFRLALAQIHPPASAQKALLKQAPTVNGLRLGNRKTRDDSAHSINELWIEGEQYHVYNYLSGAQFITGAEGRIIAARQQSRDASIEGLLKPGDPADRPLKSLGMPDRRIHLVAGEYLAYDQYGLAIQIDNGRVQGWFLY